MPNKSCHTCKYQFTFVCGKHCIPKLKYWAPIDQDMPKQTFLEKTISQFSKTARTQEMKGIEKYGHELQPMENKYDWLEMAKEELIDGFKYLAAEQERRDKLIAGIEYSIHRAMECGIHGNSWLGDALDDLRKLKGDHS